MLDFSALVELIQTQAFAIASLGVAVLGVLITISVLKWLRLVIFGTVYFSSDDL